MLVVSPSDLPSVYVYIIVYTYIYNYIYTSPFPDKISNLDGELWILESQQLPMLLRSFIMRPGVTRHAKPFDTCCRGCALGCGWLVATSFSHIEPILPSKHCGLTPSNIENNVISQSECWFDWLYPPVVSVVQPWQEKILSFKMQIQVLNNWLDMFLSLFINKTRCLLWMTIQYFWTHVAHALQTTQWFALWPGRGMTPCVVA